MVMDRFMLITFTLLFTGGTIYIIFRSPYITDTTEPLRLQVATKPLSGDTFEFDLRNTSAPSDFP